MSDYGWHVIKNLGLFILIGITVYVTSSLWGLIGLVFTSNWVEGDKNA
jgi:hypothetical protein